LGWIKINIISSYIKLSFHNLLSAFIGVNRPAENLSAITGWNDHNNYKTAWSAAIESISEI
jgi:hypothetical protein